MTVVQCSELWHKDDARLDQFLLHKLVDENTGKLRQEVMLTLQRALSQIGFVETCVCAECVPAARAVFDGPEFVGCQLQHAAFSGSHLEALSESDLFTPFLCAWAQSISSSELNEAEPFGLAQLFDDLAEALVEGDESPKALFDTFSNLGYDLNLCEAYITSHSSAMRVLSTWSGRSSRIHEALLQIIENAAESQSVSNPSLLAPSHLWVSRSDQMKLKETPKRSRPNSAGKIGFDSLAAIRLRFCLLKQFNQSLKKLLPLFDIQSHHVCSMLDPGLLLRECRCFVFRHVKNEFVLLMLDAMSVPSEAPPRVEID
jgi:hypothetical protein